MDKCEKCEAKLKQKEKIEKKAQKTSPRKISLSDWRSMESLILSFGLIFLTLGLIATSSSLLVILPAFIAIGWLQLCLLDIQEKALQGQLFQDKKTNEIIGHYLGACPLFTNLDDHKDIYEVYSQTPSLTQRNKKERLFVSAVGLVGIQRIVAILATNLGIGYITETAELKFIPKNRIGIRPILSNFRNNYLKVFGVQILMICLFFLLDAFVAYALWTLSYLTVFSLFFQLRQEKQRASKIEARAIVEEGIVNQVEDEQEPTTNEAPFIPGEVPTLRESEPEDVSLNNQIFFPNDPPSPRIQV